MSTVSTETTKYKKYENNETIKKQMYIADSHDFGRCVHILQRRDIENGLRIETVAGINGEARDGHYSQEESEIDVFF
jgi:hypothetical protein